MDVGVYGEGGHTEGLGHHHTCGFVTNPRQGLKLFKTAGHHAAMALKQELGKAFDIASLGASQAKLADMGQDRLLAQGCHRSGVLASCKQGRGDLVDLLICALGAQQDRHQQREGIAVVERYRGFGVVLLQPLHD